MAAPAQAEDVLPDFLPTAPPHHPSSGSSDAGTETTTGTTASSRVALAISKSAATQPEKTEQDVQQLHLRQQQQQQHGPHSPPPYLLPPAFPMGQLVGQLQPPPLDGGVVHALSPLPPPHTTTTTYPPPPWVEALPLPPPPFMHPGPPFAHPPMMDSFTKQPSALGFYPGHHHHLSLPPAPFAADGTVLPRPHPFLARPVLYLSSVPNHVNDGELAQVLKQFGVTPIVVALPDAIDPVDRLYPDAYYSWMTRNGHVLFSTQQDAEKALAILVRHPFLVGHLNLLVSPFPPPNFTPLPPAPVAPRLIRPLELVDGARTGTLPTESEVYDAARPWGSIREVSVVMEVAQAENKDQMRWRARVQFWYEDEARRFEADFVKGESFAGWKIDVRRDPSYIAMVALPQMAPPITPPHFIPPAYSSPTHSPQSPTTPLPPALAFIPHPGVFAPGSGQPMAPLLAPVNMVPPPTPPDSGTLPVFVAPWASHNGVPPLSSLWGGKKPLLRGAKSSSSPSSPRWKEVPGGIVADDGTVIQHGPGQHIQPAPRSGPGSHSHSGLVDYCNLIVKNLEADISGPFLYDVFRPFGHVVNARVMRDDLGRSRGYGFVSFMEPGEAALALDRMNGVPMGSRSLVVAYHEPRAPPMGRFGGVGSPVRNAHSEPRVLPTADTRVFPKPPVFAKAVGIFPKSSGVSPPAFDVAKPKQHPQDDSDDLVAQTAKLELASSHPPKPTPSTPRKSINSDPLFSPPAQRGLRSAAPSPSSRAVRPALHAIDENEMISALFEAINLDDVNVGSVGALASMGPRAALSALDRGGTELLTRLELTKLSATRLAPGKLELTRRVSKMVANPAPLGMSKSRMAARIREFINSLEPEDEEALGKLLEYPGVVQAMVLAAPSPQVSYTRSDSTMSI